MTAFLKQYYSDATFVPKEILLSHPVDEDRCSPSGSPNGGAPK